MVSNIVWVLISHFFIGFFLFLLGYDRGYMRACIDLGKERHGGKSDERKA